MREITQTESVDMTKTVIVELSLLEVAIIAAVTGKETTESTARLVTEKYGMEVGGLIFGLPDPTLGIYECASGIAKKNGVSGADQ